MVLPVSRLVIVTKPVSHAHTLGIFYWQVERSGSILLIGFPAPHHPRLKVFTLVILTSGDRHKEDISIIDFDPKNLQGESLGEIDHKIIYICPKYLNKTRTPRSYHEWMEAIEDSPDEQVEESHYTHPQVQQVFKLIEKDQVTPQERAEMFDEYSLEEVKQEQLQEIRAEAKAESLKEGKAESKAEGLKEGEQKSRSCGRWPHRPPVFF